MWPRRYLVGALLTKDIPLPKPNNPAGRIHAILTEVKNQKPNKTNRQVWATVFNIKPSDTAQLLYALSELIQQLQLTRNRIQALESIEQNLYLGPINTLKKNFITATTLWCGAYQLLQARCAAMPLFPTRQRPGVKKGESRDSPG